MSKCEIEKKLIMDKENYDMWIEKNQEGEKVHEEEICKRIYTRNVLVPTCIFVVILGVPGT